MKREASPSPQPDSPSKKRSATTKTKTIPTKKPKTEKTESNGSPKKGAWSADELQSLYEVMCPKRTGVNWNEVSAVTGRDPKSCQNKWARMQDKIVDAVRGLGEK